MFDVLAAADPAAAPNAASYTTVSLLVSVGGYILMVIALWPVFTKAGVPGWGALIPIMNIYVLVKIAGYHGAVIILYFIPIVNIIVGIFVAFGFGRAFAKRGTFSFFLLWLLSPIGYLIIGYGRSKFVGEGGRTTVMNA